VCKVTLSKVPTGAAHLRGGRASVSETMEGEQGIPEDTADGVCANAPTPKEE
jgi:hypothetical protein